MLPFCFSRVQIQSSRNRIRGPPKLLGRTKSQWLDSLQRSAAKTSFGVSVLGVVLGGALLYSFFNTVAPERREAKQKENEALLAEGKAV